MAVRGCSRPRRLIQSIVLVALPLGSLGHLEPPPAVVAAPKGWQHYEHLIGPAAASHGVPEGVLERLLVAENYAGDPVAVSNAGAVGLAQFMPETAVWLGIDPLEPRQAVYGAARYLRMQYDRFGSWEDAVRSYNWGPGNLSRWISRDRPEGELPAETKAHLSRIINKRELDE